MSNQVWIVKAFHDKDTHLLYFIGSFDNMKKVLDNEAKYNGGYLIYTEETWKRFYPRKEKKCKETSS